jgi:NAD(P)-dependent dehydrogenase (short-subunit alcohol dehydrogenase family)
MTGVGNRLAGKKALVTGGGSGIGASIVRRFREEGAEVVSADLRGGDVICDVRSNEQVATAVAETVDRFGGLDTLVCNAGRTVVGDLRELPEEDWDDGFDINLKGIWRCVRAAWPHLAENGGTVTSTASVVGLWASEGQAAYCATKAGVVMLTKCLALDAARDGIRANCVCPGFVDTPLLQGFMEQQDDPEGTREAAVGLHPVGRLGTADDVAESFVYLSSDESSWVTGVALRVDGGLATGIWSG